MRRSASSRWRSASPLSFRATVRYFRPERGSGLAVVDVPPDVITRLGGLKQVRVQAAINGIVFTSNTMPAGGGRLALSLSRATLDAARITVGEEAEFEVERLEA